MTNSRPAKISAPPTATKFRLAQPSGSCRSRASELILEPENLRRLEC